MRLLVDPPVRTSAGLRCPEYWPRLNCAFIVAETPWAVTSCHAGLVGPQLHQLSAMVFNGLGV